MHIFVLEFNTRNKTNISANYSVLFSQIFSFFRYFGSSKDLPGVKELFEQERKY